MAEDRMRRRLAAILASDVVGYSRLMGADEAGTLEAVKALQVKTIAPKIADFGGTIFKVNGDGMLAEFQSVVDAVACAVDIQRDLRLLNDGVPADRAMQLRIGINLGDVILDGADIFGDGVNVAARVEALAPPGGIAVSGTVFDHIGNRLDLRFDDMGEQTLKNIERPIRVYSVRPDEGEPAAMSLSLPDRPSIAVLPFTNMTSDPAHEYFADGMTEDLITALSRIGDLFVISRNSSFVYKGKAHRLETVARELGVRYILEGSVRASGNKIRVTAQLIDGLSGNHVWAERYDADLNDIFAVQDEVTRSIVMTLQIQLTFGETIRLWDGQTKDLRAWEKMVLGRKFFLRFNQADNHEAQRVLEAALRIDPAYTGAMVQLGFAQWWEARSNPEIDKTRYLQLAEEQAMRALSVDPDMGAAYTLRGGVAFLRDEFDQALLHGKRGVELAPSDSWANAFLGVLMIYSGEPERALATLKLAIRLSPHYPRWYTYNMASAHLWMGNIIDASAQAQKYLLQEPDDPFAYMNLALVCGIAGREGEAGRHVSALRERFPGFTLKHVALSQRYRERHKFERVMGVLRKAGLPE